MINELSVLSAVPCSSGMPNSTCSSHCLQLVSTSLQLDLQASHRCAVLVLEQFINSVVPFAIQLFDTLRLLCIRIQES